MSAASQRALAERFGSTNSDRIARSVSARALQRAIFGLLESMPDYSAHIVTTTRQRAAMIAVVVVLLATGMLWPRTMIQTLVAVMSFGFVAGLAFRVALTAIGRSRRAAPDAPAKDGLPIYTVLVPLYHEASVLPQLIKNLAALDYPAEKLDIKLIVEEDDGETRAIAQRLSPFEVVLVPRTFPRTKPKACNYALQFARGEHVVVFDAEDRPDPDQLRKAVAAFRHNPQTACFQARLCIDNAKSSWLARMFSLDYGIWFRTLLPGLDRLGAPMPLGGTSNHFRTASLVAAGAWDPFNVTEDADLGVRLSRLAYPVSMLDSSTYEEAPAHFEPWFRQRTRWMKGYAQTILVHTRNPARLVRELRVRGCLAIEFFLGGAVWSALVNPLLWAIFAVSCLAQPVDSALLGRVAWISGTSVLVANGLLAILSLTGNRQRRHHLPYVLGYPVYWLLISAAAYRAVWQLLRDPFRWEKTPHGGASE